MFQKTNGVHPQGITVVGGPVLGSHHSGQQGKSVGSFPQSKSPLPRGLAATHELGGQGLWAARCRGSLGHVQGMEDTLRVSAS